MKPRIVLTSILLIGLAVIGFAESDQASKAADGKPIKVTIGELLAKPDAYKGKQVVVQARLAGTCSSDGCLTLKDKTDVIEGIPPDGGFKKDPKPGSTINVTGIVKVKGEGKEQQIAIAVEKFEEVKQ